MNDAVTALGWVGAAVLILSVVQTRMLRLRVLNSVASVLQIVYAALSEVWPIVALNAAVLLINIHHLIRIGRERRREARQEPALKDS